MHAASRPAMWVLILCTAAACAVLPAHAALEEDFITLPPEFASRVPARLVFSQAELQQCWLDNTAKRCVLQDSIVLDQAQWQQAFQATGSSAEARPDNGPQTLTSEPCSSAGTCLPGGGGSRVLYTLNFNRFAYSMFVKPGGTLLFSNVQLFNLAQQAAYTYSSRQPFKSTGQGTTTWPSIGLAPNATLVLVNSSVLYYNPSDTDDCAAYTQKRIFAFRQVWGESNITVVNSSTNLIVGPQYIDVTIRDASTDAVLGNATVVYRNVSFICMPNTTQEAAQGISTGALAAAIAVPIAVAVVAGALLLWWCLRCRRRRKRWQLHQQAAQAAKAAAPPAARVADVEEGRSSSQSLDAAEPGGRGCDQVKVLLTDQKGDSSFARSSMDVVSAPDLAAAAAGIQLSASRSRGSAQPSADTEQQSGSGGVVHVGSSRYNSQALHGSGGMEGSGGAFDVSTFSTAATGTPSNSRAAGAQEDRFNNASALLKARSDVAVLRDLNIGPLLGRGSYGRVYRGRWKATPVAVKIIEHQAAGARSNTGKAISAGRETLLATSVSHPNVITTYHISTMSMSERSALASSWLEGGGGVSSSSSPQALHELAASRARGDDDARSSASSSDLDESPPDLLETYIIMEFCSKGSLDRALRLGKFKLSGPSAQEAEMVGIYKALLDTASGLDYLHSIGVVHGDLKTANVLLTGSSRDARGVTCKITDFGLSRVLDPEATHISTGTYGTIVYMPKELLLSGRMTQATDIYSFGLMMWELFTSQPVMDEGLSIGQMFYMIAYQDWRPEVPPTAPQATQS